MKVLVDKKTNRIKRIIKSPLTIDSPNDICPITNVDVRKDEYIISENEIPTLDRASVGDEIKIYGDVYELDVMSGIDDDFYCLITSKDDNPNPIVRSTPTEDDYNLIKSRLDDDIIEETKDNDPIINYDGCFNFGDEFVKEERKEFVDSIDDSEIASRLISPYRWIRRKQERRIYQAIQNGDVTVYIDFNYNIHLSGVDIKDKGLYVNGQFWSGYGRRKDEKVNNVLRYL